MSKRLYVVTTETSHKWLVRASSENAALTSWNRAVETGNAEPALRIDRPRDRKQITHLRDIGHADANA